MDFIDLANGLDRVTQTLLRHLVQVETTDPAGDDDFARIDGEYYHYDQSLSSSVPPLPQQQQQYYDPQSEPPPPPPPPVGGGDYFSPEDLNTAVEIGNHPFLSKSAEAELYLLATNFLLCKYTTTIFIEQ